MLMPDNILFFVCDNTKQPEKAVNVLQLAIFISFFYQYS